jgi:peptide deformylase
MSILKIARMGHPVLRRVAEPVEDPAAPEIRTLIRDMIETLGDIGGAGLAAPQVHESRRVIIFHVPAARVSGVGQDQPRPLTVLLNPVITPETDEMELGWEGCLSIPGLRGAVPRWTHIRYTGFDIEGDPVDVVAEGFHARVLQHECDHLDGVLYFERMMDMRLVGFAEEVGHYPIDLAPFQALLNEGRSA